MLAPRLQNAARFLAILAIFAGVVPTASACCCFTASPQLLSCAKETHSCCAPKASHSANQQKEAKQKAAKQVAACCHGNNAASCSCGSGDSSCGSGCWCDLCGPEQPQNPVVPSPATSQRSVDVDTALSVPIEFPVSAANIALAFCLTPDAALHRQPPSKQVLFGVWLN